MIGDWIYNMVTNRSITLEHNGVKVTKKITKGCPQGGVLSPFIWNIVFDPIIKELAKRNGGQAFADDLLIVQVGENIDILTRRTEELVNQVVKWCNNIGLTIAAEKTEIIFWTRSTKASPKKKEMANNF